MQTQLKVGAAAHMRMCRFVHPAALFNRPRMGELSLCIIDFAVMPSSGAAMEEVRSHQSGGLIPVNLARGAVR